MLPSGEITAEAVIEKKRLVTTIPYMLCSNQDITVNCVIHQACLSIFPVRSGTITHYHSYMYFVEGVQHLCLRGVVVFYFVLHSLGRVACSVINTALPQGPAYIKDLQTTDIQHDNIKVPYTY